MGGGEAGTGDGGSATAFHTLNGWVAMSILSAKYTCPCCGFPGLKLPAYSNYFHGALPPHITPPYCDFLGNPSYEVCPCCGYEFGLDDDPGTGARESFDSYLEEWIGRGGAWFTKELRPTQWRLEEQLRTIGKQHRT